MSHAPHPAIRPGNRLAAGVVESLAWLLCLLPSTTFLARGLGRLAFLLRIRLSVAMDNLRNALPEKSEIELRRVALGAYVNMTQVVLESLTSHSLSEAKWREKVRFRNLELLHEARKAGKGVLLATAHFGNWELAGCAIARMGLPFDVVVRPLKGAINARIVRNRLSSGANLILPKGAVQNVLSALAQNHVVMQLIDQAMPPEHGVQVPFFGRMAWTTPGLSIAAAKSGATVLVMKVHRVGETLEVAFEGPVEVPQTENLREDVKAHIADLSHRLESHIREYPSEWLWLHRRWKGPAASHIVTPQAPSFES